MDFDPEECGVSEKVRFTVLQELLQNYTGEELKEAVKERIDDLIPKHIIVDDIMASINYLNCLAHGVAPRHIDHLATAACAAWASCCRTSSASAFPAWSGSFGSG